MGGNLGGVHADNRVSLLTIHGYPEPAGDFLEMRPWQPVFRNPLQNAPDARTVFFDQTSLFEHISDLAIADDGHVVARKQLLHGQPIGKAAGIEDLDPILEDLHN